MNETLADAMRTVILIGVFGAIGLALGATVCPDSLWVPGLVFIGATVGGLADGAWVLVKLRDR